MGGNVSARTKVGIAVICGALLATLPATALAVFPGNNGKILFVSGRAAGDPDADVYLIDGPNDVSLDGPTDLIAGQHRHPVWSADARYIVYAIRVADAGCTPMSDEDLYLHDTLGIGGTVIIGGGSANCVLEDHPAFSPNGSQIAYESEVTNGSGQEDILMRNPDGSGTVDNLTQSATLTEATPAWSPDGDFIYYARRPNAGTEFDIYREPADGSGSATVLPDVGTASNEFQPEVSPDGTKICYTRGPFGSDDADIMVANVNGSGSPIEVSPVDNGIGGNPNPRADYDCGWSPNGKKIAFTRGTFGMGELEFVPSGGGPPFDVYPNNSGTFDGNVDWSRVPGKCDGKRATIAGTPFDDDIVGTPKNDVIVGQDGKDKIKGKGGNDRICGGKGNDTLSGVKGRDRLFGGPGNDDLNGGPQKDRCDGGPGQDAAESCERKTKI
jgi:Tol biopolymer transport system component